MEFSRDFIGQLDESAQEKYALTNAEALFTALTGITSDGTSDDDDSSGSSSCSLTHGTVHAAFFSMGLAVLLTCTGLVIWRVKS